MNIKEIIKLAYKKITLLIEKEAPETQEKEKKEIKPFTRERTENYYSFDTKEEEKFFLLEKTSSAFNDSFLINYLRYTVLMTDIEKRGPIKFIEKKYKDNVLQQIYELLCKYAPNTYYWHIAIGKIMNDMDYGKFNIQPSMNRVSNPDDAIKFSLETSRKLDCYESINLSQHLLNTMNTYIDTFEKRLDKVYFPKFEVLLACLLHDFGKSKKLQNMLNLEPYLCKRHEEVSGIYIDNLLKEMDSKYIFEKTQRDDEYHMSITQFERVRKAVVEHHSKDVADSSLSDLLKTIDAKTREREFKDYERKK